MASTACAPQGQWAGAILNDNQVLAAEVRRAVAAEASVLYYRALLHLCSRLQSATALVSVLRLLQVPPKMRLARPAARR